MSVEEKPIDYAAIGRRLKQFRKKKGITQEFIAEQLNVTVAYISNVENNKVKLNLRVLSYYANLLDVSIDYLLYTDHNRANSLDAEILKMVDYMNNDEKERLIRILHVVKETRDMK